MNQLSEWDLNEAFLALGIEQGDTLLVHSDLGALPLPEGVRSRKGILDFYYQAFRKVLGEQGTLAVPAYFYEYAREGLPFDVALTPPSKVLGAFPKFIQKLPDCLRSPNPLQSIAAVGAKAHDLVGNRSLSGYGPFSPWQKLRDLQGKMLFLGSSLQAMTFVHYIEQQVGVPHMYWKYFTIPVLENGIPIEGEVVSAVRYLDFPVSYEIAPFQKHLAEKGFLREVEVHGRPLFLVDAETAYWEGVELLQKDVFYFLKERPQFCQGSPPLK